MTILTETLGRQALVSLSGNYKSVADALMELIDNPFDYRRGRFLTVDITVDKARDELVVFDHGGEGMDESTLSDWISWGTGHEHSRTDIGQYHVGGKLAAIYLADSLEIVCKRHGSSEIYRFIDPHWGTRTELVSIPTEKVTLSHLPKDIRDCVAHDPQVGFAWIRLSQLKSHRYEVGVLEAKLSNSYRSLLLANDVSIIVNGSIVTPLDIPHAPSHEDRDVIIPTTKLEGLTVKGRIWIADRDKFKVGRGVGVRAGIRTVFNGRLITDGEEFNHYLAGRGSLQRLVGEIEINHFRPNTMKSGWDRDDPKWQRLEAFMFAQMQPLVTFLNSLIEGRPVSREQRKMAEQVRRDVEETLKRVARRFSAAGTQQDEEIEGAGGRASPVPRDENAQTRSTEGSRERSDVAHRTPPPEDPIGRLLRKMRTGVPPIDFDDLGKTSRIQTRLTEAGPRFVINREFPLFEALGGTSEYLAETVFLHLLAEDEDSKLTPGELVVRLDELLFVWGDVQS